jgi:putative ABC transport system permease protein
VAAGLGPALKASQTRPQEALKGRSPRSGHRSALRDTMVVLQLAISLTLLVGAALLGRSFLRLLQVNPGFSPENVLTVSLRPVGDAAPFYEKLTARIASLPQVSGAGVISTLPLTEGNTSLNVFPQGKSIVPTGESIQANWRLVDGGYFSAMQIPLVQGRTFAGLTPNEARRAAVISTSLARQLWGDRDPIGLQFDPGGNQRFLTVIGVVGDVRGEKLGIEPAPTFYWSMHRFIYGPMKLVVRSTGNLAPLLPAIRAAIKEIDPTVPVFRVRTLEDLRASSLEQERIVLALLAGFTGVALLLAALGTYGVIAFTVQQRTQEIGIRIAVGAQASDIFRLIIGQGMKLVLTGALLGVAGALAASRLLATLLYNTGATDPSSYLVATTALTLITLGAAFLPARRATRVDPIIALRSE